jgi:hypothetical protein
MKQYKQLLSFGSFIIIATLLLSACGGGAAGVVPAATQAGSVPRFAYVANSGDNTVSIYTADAATVNCGITAMRRREPLLMALPWIHRASSPIWRTGAPARSQPLQPLYCRAEPPVRSRSIPLASSLMWRASPHQRTSAGTVRGRSGMVSMVMTRGTAAVKYTPKFAYVAN